MSEEKTKITPEAVVARYKELGLKAEFGGLGVKRNPDGRIVAQDGGHCALGIMAIGRVYEHHFDLAQAICADLGISWWPFVDGFDGRYVSRHSTHPDFRLGVQCRLAVLRADLVEGFNGPATADHEERAFLR